MRLHDSFPLIAIVASLTTFNFSPSNCFAQGALTPPGAPGPLFKTLQQIEPRTPISSMPFTITNAGSYYLTGNMTSATDGLFIQASGVTVDLMGFELSGGTGSGIFVTGLRTNITIRNGTVRGWGSAGVNALNAKNSRFEALRIANNNAGANFANGMSVGKASTVSDCAASDNFGVGIYADSGSVVSRCTAHNNIGTGISVESESTVSGCVARQNTAHGISAQNGSTISGCTASGNSTTGIDTASGCTVNGCTVVANLFRGISVIEGCTVSGCTARTNASDGIVADAGSTVSGCTSSVNTGDGIKVTSSCRVTDNTCAGNGAGAGDGAGINATSSRNRIDSNNVMGNDRGIDCNPATTNLIIRNSARGNTLNYDILAGNNSGAIILTPGVGFSSSNPWANFEF